MVVERKSTSRGNESASYVVPRRCNCRYSFSNVDAF
jgi:hypothetical protein